MANPDDDPQTANQFAHGLLNKMGISFATVGQAKFYASWAVVSAWALAEGGHWKNSAKFNPLNTSQKMPGSKKINNHGVQAYTSWAQGYEATIKTLNNGKYDGMLAALKGGNSAAFVKDLKASPWGTKDLVDPKSKLPTAGNTTGGNKNDPANTAADVVGAGIDLATGEDTTNDDSVGSATGQAIEAWKGPLAKLLTALTSGEFWKNTAFIAAGAVLVILAVVMLMTSSKTVRNVATAVTPVGRAVGTTAATVKKITPKGK